MFLLGCPGFYFLLDLLVKRDHFFGLLDPWMAEAVRTDAAGDFGCLVSYYREDVPVMLAVADVVIFERRTGLELGLVNFVRLILFVADYVENGRCELHRWCVLVGLVALPLYVYIIPIP